MKVAFVHCRTFPGGALDVLGNLINKEAFDEAILFTLIYDKSIHNQLGTLHSKLGPIITPLPQRINNIFLYFSGKNVPFFSKIFDYRNLIIFSPWLMKRLSKKIKKYCPEKIVISSFAIAKNIEFCNPLNTAYGAFNIPTKLYLHSPMQYIRSHHQEYIQKLSGWQKKLFEKFVPRLQKRDKKYTKFDETLANSNYTAKLAKDLYDIDAKVTYPHIKDEFYLTSLSINPSSYYVYVGRLVKFVKEVDKIIALFNKNKLPLLIMGSGPDELELKAIAGDNIIFIDRINDTTERAHIIKQARGMINITKESFGLVTAESLLLGVPVFGYNDGATPELVDNHTGILVDNKDIETLEEKFTEFHNTQRNRKKIYDTIRDKL